ATPVTHDTRTLVALVATVNALIPGLPSARPISRVAARGDIASFAPQGVVHPQSDAPGAPPARNAPPALRPRPRRRAAFSRLLALRASRPFRRAAAARRPREGHGRGAGARRRSRGVDGEGAERRLANVVTGLFGSRIALAPRSPPTAPAEWNVMDDARVLTRLSALQREGLAAGSVDWKLLEQDFSLPAEELRRRFEKFCPTLPGVEAELKAVAQKLAKIPSIPARRKWLPEDVDNLIRAVNAPEVRFRRKKNWELIGARVGKSGKDCLAKYRSLKQRHASRFLPMWTVEEDAELLASAENNVLRLGRPDWKRVAVAIGRTETTVWNRFYWLRRTGSVPVGKDGERRDPRAVKALITRIYGRAPWSEDETKEVVRVANQARVRLARDRWKAAAAELERKRSPLACRLRVYRVSNFGTRPTGLLPLWTAFDDTELTACVEEFKKSHKEVDWKSIAATLNRPLTTVSRRVALLNKKMLTTGEIKRDSHGFPVARRRRSQSSRFWTPAEDIALILWKLQPNKPRFADVASSLRRSVDACESRVSPAREKLFSRHSSSRRPLFFSSFLRPQPPDRTVLRTESAISPRRPQGPTTVRAQP
ncbi:MAG: hypothetical protein BJ554DRAFT_4944, partial [Olpidium bornovanus]